MVAKLIPDETAGAVVADYLAGVKILDIEKRYDISRSTLYWTLEQAGVAPERAKRGARLKGNTKQLAMLYELIGQQQEALERARVILTEIGANPQQAETLAKQGLKQIADVSETGD